MRSPLWGAHKGRLPSLSLYMPEGVVPFLSDKEAEPKGSEARIYWQSQLTTKRGLPRRGNNEGALWHILGNPFGFLSLFCLKGPFGATTTKKPPFAFRQRSGPQRGPPFVCGPLWGLPQYMPKGGPEGLRSPSVRLCRSERDAPLAALLLPLRGNDAHSSCPEGAF